MLRVVDSFCKQYGTKSRTKGMSQQLHGTLILETLHRKATALPAEAAMIPTVLGKYLLKT